MLFFFSIMCCYNVLVMLVYVVMSVMKCNPSIIPNSSLETSIRISGIGKLMITFDNLYDIQFMCNSNTRDLWYCYQLVKDKDNFLPLKHVVITKINEIRTILTKLLILEKKAIVCRGMRHLLPIVERGLLVDGLSQGKENSEEPTANRDGGPSGSHPKRSFGYGVAAGTAVVDFVERIDKTIRAIQPFAEGLRFENVLRGVFGAVGRAVDAKSRSEFLSYARGEIDNVYRTDCWREALQVTDGGGRGITELVREADGLFARVSDDFRLLRVRYSAVVDGTAEPRSSPKREISVAFHQLLGKSRDAELWRLIGNEPVASDDGADARPTRLDEAALNAEERIDKLADELLRSLQDSFRCRCLAYAKLVTGLCVDVIRALLANARDIRPPSEKSLAFLNKLLRRKGVDGRRSILTPDEAAIVFRSFHVHIGKLGVDRPVLAQSNAILAAVDELNRDGTAAHGFGHVFAAYLMYVTLSVGDVAVYTADYLDDIGLEIMEFEIEEFGVILHTDVAERIWRDGGKALNRKTVETLIEWRKRSERSYAASCFSGDSDVPQFLDTVDENTRRQTLLLARENTLDGDGKTKTTLTQIIETIEKLNKRLETDLRLVEGCWNE